MYQPGQPVRLAKDAYPFIKIREWEFAAQEGKKLILRYPPKGYILEVRPEEIDRESAGISQKHPKERR